MKLCKFCGKEIDEKRIYCSRSCRNKANPRQGHEEPHIPKICEICGKEFLATRRDRKYCSDSCNWTARRRRQPQRLRPDQTYWRKHRQEVLDRQNGLCWLCCGEIGPSTTFEVHHLQGDHDPRSDDVIALHRGCHNQFHKVDLLIVNGQIVYRAQIHDQVLRRLKEITND